ncbi:chaperone modulator CbpM [Spongiactinospora sp. TRM90649]|uniref:chaperone modulator CbpM n=1 Tax=Spongiactinospora sp. TRM90649 TaxID=3031114 RepID=UPI0023F76353|nr:chaperone modulator CbpM [Spongiactinospora sp. TRM90649]MDF5757972.1 chaperone modulator CbpM [Spongiactinospora sp. TRM90649]
MTRPTRATRSAGSAARVTYALVRPVRLDLESFARATGLHPEVVRRLVALGVLEPDTDARGDLCFAPAQVAAAARVQRLHAGLPLSYAAIGLVMDLLDRVERLEAELRDVSRHQEGMTWTRTG